MIILGIDPGIATMGYGIINYFGNSFNYITCGAITTAAGERVERRLALIYDRLNCLIKTYTPDAVAVEELFFNTNQKTAINVAQARGIVLLSSERAGIPLFEYTPLQVKQAVVGYGRAEKHQVMEMTKVLLGLNERPKPDDAADALALAICHAHNSSSKLAGLNKINPTKRTGGK
ncbi:MAG: crossover junction endodeoxyribonuclease RuvC [Ruminococcaceae bacterium]|nr:crossover junction endodeoxyribonuclease RuvC [Oscillospiraceae bacterium]